MRKFLFIVTLLLIAVTSVQLWMTKDKTDQKEAAENVVKLEEPSLGGDFALTDQTGKTVHDADFRGRVMLVFFGFTHCPDICPVTVATLSKTMELLGDKADSVAPIFVTVDPARDTPAALKAYLANFDKRFVGLTGTADQIKQVASLYKAYYAPAAAAEDHDHDHDAHHEDNTGINHSGYIYLMGKDGKFIKVFPYDVPAQELATAIQPYVK